MNALTTESVRRSLPVTKALDTEAMHADTLPDFILPEISAAPAAQAPRDPALSETDDDQNWLTFGILLQLAVLISLLIFLKEGVVFAYAIEHVVLALAGTVLFFSPSRRLGKTLVIIATFPGITVLPFLLSVAFKFQ